MRGQPVRRRKGSEDRLTFIGSDTEDPASGVLERTPAQSRVEAHAPPRRSLVGVAPCVEQLVRGGKRQSFVRYPSPFPIEQTCAHGADVTKADPRRRREFGDTPSVTWITEHHGQHLMPAAIRGESRDDIYVPTGKRCSRWTPLILIAGTCSRRACSSFTARASICFTEFCFFSIC